MFLGSNDESFSDLFKRTVRGNISSQKGKLASYNALDTLREAPPGRFTVSEFRFTSRGAELNCLYWTHIESSSEGAVVHSSNKCVLYVHTNTRAAIDASEVLPLCIRLGADLMAFDLPGCG